ncbi:MAG: SpoIIE family protein phosphatase, partial [Pyrinomonadaceae bacterium]
LVVLLFCAPSAADAQEAGGAAATDAAFVLSAETLREKGRVGLDEAGWRYMAGDSPAYAAREFDDGGWERVSDTYIRPDAPPRAGWRGRGWFRLRLRVDERLVGQPLALRVWHRGASEIYVDGEPVGSFGRITAEADEEYNPRGLFVPVVFRAGVADTHTVAVRYSYMASGDTARGRGSWLARGAYGPWFSLAVAPVGDALLSLERRARNERLDYVFAGLLFALALVHFLLYVFYRRERGNLYYSFFALGLGAFVWLSSVSDTGHHSAAVAALVEGMKTAAQCLAMAALLAFLYVEFTGGLSRFFWVMLWLWVASIAVLTLTLLFRNQMARLFALAVLFVSLGDSVRIMARALRERRRGAWIIAAGVGVLAASLTVVVAAENKLVAAPAWLYQLGLNAVILSVPLAVSIYLARSFARTNRDLETKLAQVEELSARQLEHERREAALRVEHERTRAENERRAKELEEARQLQLSMLPAKLPDLPHVEVAAYMKPATEVGGDYYDFHVSLDGTLTVAVGDATGHGLRAGTMVTATKSLFRTYADEPDITHVFKQSSRVLKEMNLRGLYMAMTMMKVKDGRLRVLAAGMPPVLVCRAATGRVEEVSIKAMPLGSVRDFPYRERELSVSEGDTVVVMSDGFAERFNEQGEMLDYARAAAVLAEVAHRSPQEIIDHFVRTGDEWAGTRFQDDDVTFVVLKVRNGDGRSA